MHIARIFVAIGVLLLSEAAWADSSEPAQPGPIGVVQFTPGLHLVFSGANVGAGLSLDLLGGVVFGDREYNPSSGLIAGPLVEFQIVRSQGPTLALGARAGAGALAPTATLGFVPYAMGTFDYSYGFLRGGGGHRWGAHIRALYGGAGAYRRDDGDFGFRVGAELPILPVPAIH